MIAPTPTIHSVPRSAGVAEALKIYHRDGLVLIKDFLSQDQVAAINAEVDSELEKMDPGSPLATADIQLFYGTNTKRLNGIPTISKTFREVILDGDYVHDACAEIFKESGAYWLNMAQVMDIGPGTKAQPLHRDEWINPIYSKFGHTAPEAICNFFIGLGKCTAAAGATRVVLGSHKWDDMLDAGSPEMTVPGEMEAGDCILFSGKLLHGGGENTTETEHRKALSVSISSAHIITEEANCLTYDRKHAETLPDRAQAMLGFKPMYPHGPAGVWIQNFRETIGAQGVMNNLRA